MKNLATMANKKKNVTRLVSLLVVITIVMCYVAIGYCEGETPTLDIEFDTAQMFAWAQTIITAMMPVLYIIMGVGLGFIVIRAFKSAFN